MTDQANSCVDIGAGRCLDKVASIGFVSVLLAPGRSALRLGRRRSWRKPVAAHDRYHLGSVGRTAGCGADHLRSLTEVQRSDRGRRDRAKHPRVPAAIVVESVNGTTWNAQ